MATDYTLSELATLGGVSTRTVRYYIAQGLLPAPVGQGPAARYTEAHLDRLRLIRKLQAAHLPLAEIRRQLASLPVEQVAQLAESTPVVAPPGDSALDYIESLLKPNRALFAMAVPPATPARAVATPPAPAVTGPKPAPEPERAQWERISLDPDIELHIRRPLTRRQNKRVERLISIARQLLEEDQP